MPKDQIPDSIYKELEEQIKALNESGDWFLGKVEGEYWDRYGRNNIKGAAEMLKALQEGDLDALMKAHVEHNKIQDGYASFSDLDADERLRGDTESSDRIADLTIRAKLNSLVGSDQVMMQTVSKLREGGMSEWKVIERLVGRTWGYESE